MAAVREAPSLPEPEWDPDQVLLKDYLMRYDTPMTAKVVKGQFMNIGVSKFNPLKKLYQDVVIHSIKAGVKVLGHSVAKLDSRDGRASRLVSLEQRLSIPLTYQGWFELVSEDGRSARPVETVYQLGKLYPEVSKVLVRQNIKAYLPNDDGKLTFDKTRIVTSGEQLTLTGDIPVPTPAQMEGKVKLLKCVDSKGCNLYLSFDQRGSFMPIAGPMEITGVLTMKDIVQRYRLPLTVKLIQGVWPKVDTGRFTGIIRLDWVYTDETAFMCPIEKANFRIYPVPTDVNLRIAIARNNFAIKESEAFRNIMVKCSRMVNNYNNTIHLIIAVPEGAVKTKQHTNLFSGENKSINNNISRPTNSKIKRSRSKEDILLEEIDDLYGYLRDGKQPPRDKFAHDSDEESYFEEPAYEPLDDFRARLNLLNQGKSAESQRTSKYNFVDPRLSMGFKTPTGQVSDGRRSSNGYVANGVIHKQISTDSPPPVPPRNYLSKRSDSAPQLMKVDKGFYVSAGSDAGRGHMKQQSVDIPKGPHRKSSKDSHTSGSKDSKGSKGSSSEQRMRDGRSSKTGSSSAKHGRKSMPLLYL